MVESALSTEAQGTTVLPAPSSVSADYQTGDVVVSWTKADDSSDGSIEVEKSRDGGSSWTTIATGLTPSTTSYTDTGVSRPAELRYRIVRVTDHTAATSASATEYTPSNLSSEVNAVTVLPAPSDLSSSFSSGSIDLSWTINDLSEDGGIDVERSSDGGSTYSDVATGLAPSTTSYSDSSITTGESYTYRVERNTDHATATSGTTTQQTLTSPSNLSVTASTEDQLDLSWTAADGEDGYYVYRAESSGSTQSDYTQIANLAAGTTSYTDTSREDGEQYFYRVASYAGSAEKLSGEASGTTILPAPSSLTAGLERKTLDVFNPLGAYPVESLSGGTLDDISGSNYDGTADTDATINNGALQFVGFSSDDIEIPQSANPEWYNGENITYGVAFRTEADGVIYSVSGGGHVPSISIDDQGNIGISLHWHGTAEFTQSSSGGYNDGKIHTIIGTYENGTETLYVDGTQVDQRTGLLQDDFNNGDYVYTLGGDPKSSWGALPGNISGEFTGEVFSFYSRKGALSGADIGTLDKLLTGNAQQIALSWTTNDDSTDGGIDIERSTDGGSSYSTLASGLAPTTTTYSDSTVAPGETYDYRIERNTTHATATSGSIQQVVITPPIGLSLDASVTDEITLSWDDANGENGYYIYRAQSSGSTQSDYTQIANIASDSTSYTDTGVEDGEQYYYRVASYVTTTERLSAEVAGVSQLPAPDLGTLDGTNSEVDVAWTNNDDSTDGGLAVDRKSGSAVGNTGTTDINGKTVFYETDTYGTWICVLNYEHYAGNDPSVTPGNTFPQLPNGRTTASDVKSSGSNGELRHVDNIDQYYNNWGVDAVRLEATTTNHSRKIHFFSTDQGIIDAIVKTEQGGETSVSDFTGSGTTLYDDHTANLPGTASSNTSSNSNRIFGYEFPIYNGGQQHWALSGNGSRWEVDDYPSDDSNSTVHRVWVRATNVGIGSWGAEASGLSPSTTSYTDTTVKLGQTYSYRIDRNTDHKTATSGQGQVTVTNKASVTATASTSASANAITTTTALASPAITESISTTSAVTDSTAATSLGGASRAVSVSTSASSTASALTTTTLVGTSVANGTATTSTISESVATTTLPTLAVSPSAPATATSSGSVTGTTGLDTTAVGAFSNGWNYRKVITVDPANVAGDLSAWPMVVHLTDSDLAEKAQSSGADIRFEDDTGTKLSHEIESYDGSTGELWAHVKLPSVSSSSETTIYVYYGNSGASDQQNVADVWSNDFEGVYHLTESASGTGTADVYRDSTANNHHLTDNVSASGDGGLIASGQEIDGSDDYIGGDKYAGLDLATATYADGFTMSAHVKPSQNTGGRQPAVTIADGVSGGQWQSYLSYGGTSAGDQIFASMRDGSTGSQTDIETAQDYAPSTYHYIVNRWDGSTNTQSVVVDGVEQVTASIAQPDNTDKNTLHIGRFPNFANYGGDIDEVRICSTTRSEAWLQTNDINQNDPQSFYTVGTEESGAQPATTSATTNALLATTALDTPTRTVTVSTGTSSTTSGTTTASLPSTAVSNDTPTATDATVTKSPTSLTTTTRFAKPRPDTTASATVSPTSLSTRALTAGTATSTSSTGSTSATTLDAPARTDSVSTTTASSGTTATTALGTTSVSDSVATATTVTEEALTPPILSGTFDNGWNYRKSITVDSDKVDGDLTEWPMVVHLTDTDLANKAQSSGDDIRFEDDTGTQLSHEIESFDASTGDLWAHVKLPSVSSSADTTIYLYYGNSDASNQESVADVWSNNFDAVYHLDESASGTGNTGVYRDSTDNNRHADDYVSATGQTGVVSDGQSFDPSANDRIITSVEQTIDDSSFTISAWFQSNSTAYGTIVDTYNGSFPQVSLQYNEQQNGMDFRVNDGSNLTIPTAGTLGKGVPHFVGGVRDGTEFRIHLDGAIRDRKSQSGFASDLTKGQPFWIGRRPDGIGTIDGFIDEVRFASVSRSDAWMSTTYANQNDPATFYTVGVEEGGSSLATDIEGHVTISWERTDTVSSGSFAIDRSKDGGSTYTTIATGIDLSTRTYEDTGTEGGGTFTYRVRRVADTRSVPSTLETIDVTVSTSVTSSTATVTDVTDSITPTTLNTPAITASVSNTATSTTSATATIALGSESLQTTVGTATSSGVSGSLTTTPLATAARTADVSTQAPVSVTTTATALSAGAVGTTTATNAGSNEVITATPLTAPARTESVSTTSTTSASTIGRTTATVSAPASTTATGATASVALQATSVSTSTPTTANATQTTVPVALTTASPTASASTTTATSATTSASTLGAHTVSATSPTDATVSVSTSSVSLSTAARTATAPASATASSTIGTTAIGSATRTVTVGTATGSAVSATTTALGPRAVTPAIPTATTATTSASPTSLGTTATSATTATATDASVSVTPTSLLGQTATASTTTTTSASVPSGVFDNGWAYRKAITVDSAKVEGDLTNWPMTVHLTDSDLAEKAQSSGDDIRFENDSGTQLAHEIETFDASTGELWAHVKLPSVSSSSDTTIYLYYGNSDASNQESVADVWTNGFEGVWHLEESSGPFTDSTANGLDGTKNDDSVSETAQIGQGQDFDSGGNDRIVVPDDPALDIEDELTFSFWARNDGASGGGNEYPRPVAKGQTKPSNGAYGIFVEDTGSSSTVGLRSGNGDDTRIGQTVTYDDAPHLFTGVYDAGGTSKFFFDGVKTNTESHSATIPTTSDPLTIGAGNDSSSRAFNGLLDEVRVCSTARSDAWMSTTYANQNDPATFYTVGAEEQAPGLPTTELGTATRTASLATNTAVATSTEVSIRNIATTGTTTSTASTLTRTALLDATRTVSVPTSTSTASTASATALETTTITDGIDTVTALGTATTPTALTSPSITTGVGTDTTTETTTQATALATTARTVAVQTTTQTSDATGATTLDGDALTVDTGTTTATGTTVSVSGLQLGSETVAVDTTAAIDQSATTTALTAPTIADATATTSTTTVTATGTPLATPSKTAGTTTRTDADVATAPVALETVAHTAPVPTTTTSDSSTIGKTTVATDTATTATASVSVDRTTLDTIPRTDGIDTATATAVSTTATDLQTASLTVAAPSATTATTSTTTTALATTSVTASASTQSTVATATAPTELVGATTDVSVSTTSTVTTTTAATALPDISRSVTVSTATGAVSSASVSTLQPLARTLSVSTTADTAGTTASTALQTKTIRRLTSCDTSVSTELGVSFTTSDETATASSASVTPTTLDTASVQVSDPGFPDDPVLHYSLTNLSDGTVTDQSGNGHTGTVDGAIETTSTLSEGAASFDGDDEIVVEYDADGEVIFEDWTVSGWIKPDDWSDGTRKEWLSVNEDVTTGRPLDFVHEHGEIRHYRGVAFGDLLTHDVASLSGWHHMVVRQKRTGPTTVTVEMFLDGVSVGEATGDYENMRPSLNFVVGKIVDAGFYWVGDIDEVRLYDRYVTDSEVSALYASPVPRQGVETTTTTDPSLARTGFAVDAPQTSTGTSASITATALEQPARTIDTATTTEASVSVTPTDLQTTASVTDTPTTTQLSVTTSATALETPTASPSVGTDTTTSATTSAQQLDPTSVSVSVPTTASSTPANVVATTLDTEALSISTATGTTASTSAQVESLGPGAVTTGTPTDTTADVGVTTTALETTSLTVDVDTATTIENAYVPYELPSQAVVALAPTATTTTESVAPVLLETQSVTVSVTTNATLSEDVLFGLLVDVGSDTITSVTNTTSTELLIDRAVTSQASTSTTAATHVVAEHLPSETITAPITTSTSPGESTSATPLTVGRTGTGTATASAPTSSITPTPLASISIRDGVLTGALSEAVADPLRWDEVAVSIDADSQPAYAIEDGAVEITPRTAEGDGVRELEYEDAADEIIYHTDKHDDIRYHDD
jgi:hypothetical protein